MQKVVHLIFTLESGGSENMLVDIANEQAKHAAVSIILINNKYSTPLVNRISNKVQFHALGRSEGNKRSPMFLLRLWKLLANIKPNVIHCHNHKIIQLLPWHRHKAVFTAHCMNIPATHLKKYRQVYAISNAVADDLKDIATRVVPNGIDFSKWQPRTNKPEGCIKIVQVSRMVHELKGQDLLLRALTKIPIDISVDFIGAGPSMAYLQKLSAELGLQDSVRFLGEQSREYIYQHLPDYDLLVQPSRQEGFGLTIVEGIAAGLPVVASNLPGPAEILDGIPNGFLFTPDSVNALAKKIIIALEEHRSVEPSRKMMKARYGIEETAQAYLNQYRTLKAVHV